MLPAVLLGNLRLWDIPGGIWIYGPNVWQGSHAWEEPPAGILHRFVLDMACLQVLGLHYGLEKVGAAIVPSSTGNTKKQIMFMKDFASTLLVATPSYALRIAEVAEEIGVDVKKELKIKIGLVGSELMTEAMRQEMYKAWGDNMMLTQNYGMSELMGPGVSGECLELCGMHVNEDHFIPEIINPKTGEVLPPGEIGELVITCITKEALPLIRYRTKDLTRLNV